MALIDHLKQWLQDLAGDDTGLKVVIDAVEGAFAEVANDEAVMDGDTVIAEASANGLARWGIDLNEPRLANQSDLQYAGALEAVYQGNMVGPTGIAFAIAKYGITAFVVDPGYACCYADQCYSDQTAYALEGERVFLVVFDPWNPSTVTLEADFAQRVVNAAHNIFRIKGRGVKFIPLFPPSVTVP